MQVFKIASRLSLTAWIFWLNLRDKVPKNDSADSGMT